MHAAPLDRVAGRVEPNVDEAADQIAESNRRVGAGSVAEPILAWLEIRGQMERRVQAPVGARLADVGDRHLAEVQALDR